MSTALEAAIATPVVLLVAVALLLSAPPSYLAARETAIAAAAATDEGGDVPSAGLVRTIMTVTDSASLLSGWIPGLGAALAAIGGSASTGDGGPHAQE